jgi:hypothetical protein
MHTGLESFLGLSALLKPEVAAVFSAILAVGSVGLNYYGNLMTESKRVELQKEVRSVSACVFQSAVAHWVSWLTCRMACRITCRSKLVIRAVDTPECTFIG